MARINHPREEEKASTDKTKPIVESDLTKEYLAEPRKGRTEEAALVSVTELSANAETKPDQPVASQPIPQPNREETQNEIASTKPASEQQESKVDEELQQAPESKRPEVQTQHESETKVKPQAQPESKEADEQRVDESQERVALINISYLRQEDEPLGKPRTDASPSGGVGTKRKRDEASATQQAPNEPSRRPRETKLSCTCKSISPLTLLGALAHHTFLRLSDFSRRMECLGKGTLSNLADELSDEKNIESSNLPVVLIEHLKRASPPASSDASYGAHSEESEALLADLLQQIDVRKRSQHDLKERERAAGKSRSRALGQYKSLVQQTLEKLEPALSADRTSATTSRTGTTATIVEKSHLERVLRFVVHMSRIHTQREDEENEERIWRILLEQLMSVLMPWRRARDLHKQGELAGEGEPHDEAMLRFVRMLRFTSTAWRDVLHLDASSPATVPEAKLIACAILRLITNAILPANEKEETSSAEARTAWANVCSACNWDTLGDMNEEYILAYIINHLRGLGTHRPDGTLTLPVSSIPSCALIVLLLLFSSQMRACAARGRS